MWTPVIAGISRSCVKCDRIINFSCFRQLLLKDRRVLERRLLFTDCSLRNMRQLTALNSRPGSTKNPREFYTGNPRTLSTGGRLCNAEEAPVKKDNIVTVPNLLCLSRIVAAPVLSNMIIQGNFEPAAVLFVAAGFTDLLDGWIARNFKGQASSLGSFLDPLSDKILVCTLYLSLTYANLIPASLTGLIVSRDLFLVYAGLYIRYMSVNPPFTLKKYFDISLPTATVQPTLISKINTGLQFLLITVSLAAPVFHFTGHPSLHYLWALTGTTTFLSAVSYAFMKDTYKFSNRAYDHQFGKKLTAFILFILFNVAFTLLFPSQTLAKENVYLKKECPLTGEEGGDCPILEDENEQDVYSERSQQYYLKQIKRQDNRI